MRYTRGWFALVLGLAGSLGCESGSETVLIEDYDADHGLRALRHERSLDFAWANPRMQHVVRVVIPSVDPLTGDRGQSECSGVLVGADLVLTAAHCLKDTQYVSSSCRVTVRPSAGRGVIEFDVQQIQDSGAGGPAAPPPAMRRSRRVALLELAAHPGGLAFAPELTPGGDPVCSIPTRNRQFDAALLRLAEPIVDRGVARVRTTPPIPGQLLPVIHHPAAGPKAFGAARAEMPQPSIAPGAHIATPITLPSGLPTIQGGSSGAPLFDEEGYVLGLVSRPCKSGTGSCVMFANVASLMTISSFAAALSPAEVSSGFGLGAFAAPPLGDLRVTRTSFGAGPELPRRLARRGGGSILAGFATESSGQHVFALVAFDALGILDTGFGTGGLAQHDVLGSSTEELVDVAVQTITGEDRYVAVGTLADPDSIAVVRFTTDGALDATFGTGGVIRLVAGDSGATGAAVAIDPADQSIVVVGHAGVTSSDRPHGSPVVFRLEADGTPAAICGGASGFVWRPEGPGLLDAETFDQWLATGLSPTYDMVVTDAILDRRSGIVMVGYVHLSDFHGRSAWIGRLTADCAPDQSFGPGGSGAHVFGTSGFFPDADNAWLSAVVEDSDTGRLFAGGTLTAFDAARGFFAGRMFVAAFLPDGSFDETGFGSPLSGARGGAVALADGWHQETFGIALHRPAGDEPRVMLAGATYEHAIATGSPHEPTRRIQMASFFFDGSIAAQRRPDNPPGVVDAWATDVITDAGGELVIAVAHRSE